MLAEVAFSGTRASECPEHVSLSVGGWRGALSGTGTDSPLSTNVESLKVLSLLSML